ncbi:MAG: FAD-dependent oxidoreductase [Myxococcales bacterium]|nr:FAD-dependent oxidoreductase [Myxococcales bacterium]
MKRRDLLAGGLALGAAGPALSLLGSCARAGRLHWDVDVRFTGRTLVIGAGAAGLAAGYLLDRYGADYEILEAASRVGGRVKRLEGFADFPIDLGAEWIHADPALLSRMVDDPDVQGSIDLIRYSPQTTRIWNGSRLTRANWIRAFYGEYKFERTTWYGFLEDYILPASEGRIRLDTAVTTIDTTGDRIAVGLSDGTVEEADRVVVTVPLKILQEGDIAFTPELPDWKRQAIDAVTIPDGLKVFLEMAEPFYPDLTVLNALSAEGATDHLAYDAAFRKEASRHVLALFCVGRQATDYVSLDDAGIVDRLVARLDEAFEGAASRSLLQAHVQNWSAEPTIRGAYSYDWEGSYTAIIDDLRRTVDQRVYWAGEAMSAEAVSTVHGAMQTAYDAVTELLETPS